MNQIKSKGAICIANNMKFTPQLEIINLAASGHRKYQYYENYSIALSGLQAFVNNFTFLPNLSAIILSNILDMRYRWKSL